jgi:hypothetical protein
MPVVTNASRAYSARPVPNLNELPDDALLTDAHVAVISTFPVVTLKYWRKTGRGPHVTTIEGRPRYRAADVRAWINGASRAE